MPASRSATSRADPPTPRASLARPLLMIAVLAVIGVVIVALPASLCARFLPSFIDAQDFSGTLWHGSAGRLAVNGRDLGALEWRLQPFPLLRLAVAANVHWVRVGFVADGDVEVRRDGMSMHELTGGGPLEDIGDLGLPSGLRGTARFNLKDVKLVFGDAATTVAAAVGELDVADLSLPGVADGTPLGGYALHLAADAVAPDGGTTAQLNDTGGPLEVRASLHYSPKDRSGLLTGTVKERPDASPAVRGQLENLAQLHARDAQGRIPIDLEFTL